MRIVLDTNVLIAALIARGVCCDLVEHCVQRHTIVASAFILNELRKHLAGKFKYDPQEAEDAVSLFQSVVELVVPAEMDAGICRDPDDDMILATALSGNAQCIVTGDKDLLALRQFHAIRIISPAEFSVYEAQTNP